jgi:hypothetical protein
MNQDIPEELCCTVCKKEPADTETNPDWKSDTTIRCCSDCADMLNRAKHYQYNYNMPKSFYAQHKEKLNNATDELMREYERLYGKK